MDGQLVAGLVAGGGVFFGVLIGWVGNELTRKQKHTYRDDGGLPGR